MRKRAVNLEGVVDRLRLRVAALETGRGQALPLRSEGLHGPDRHESSMRHVSRVSALAIRSDRRKPSASAAAAGSSAVLRTVRTA